MARKKRASEPKTEVLLSPHTTPIYEVAVVRRRGKWTTTVRDKRNGKTILSSTSQRYSRRIDGTGPVLDLLSAAMVGRVRVVATIES